MISALQQGTRIRLVSMKDDPNPLPNGALGTILNIHHRDGGTGRWLQIEVHWDNGRKMMLTSPPDDFEVLPTLPTDGGS